MIILLFSLLKLISKLRPITRRSLLNQGEELQLNLDCLIKMGSLGTLRSIQILIYEEEELASPLPWKYFSQKKFRNAFCYLKPKNPIGKFMWGQPRFDGRMSLRYPPSLKIGFGIFWKKMWDNLPNEKTASAYWLVIFSSISNV